MLRSIRRVGALAMAMTLVALLLSAAAVPAGAAPGDFTLTILHNNDAESQLINAGSGLEDFGGVARFKTLIDDPVTGLRPSATTDGVMLISSGDNFLAGPEFNLSLDKGVPFYDTIAAEALGYDALAFGNHDFDFGPDVLADFIDGFTSTMPPFWASANLSFDAEPRLKAMVDAGVIVGGTEFLVGGETVGVIGLTTTNLPFISSPRDVVVDDDLAGLVQAVADAMTLGGTDKIILTSHLQNINNEIELAEMLTDIDVIIAGGGDELLANATDLLIPGDVAEPAMPYPMLATDKDGKTVPVVTTPGEYKYVGVLEVTFDASGDVTAWSGGPVRVSGTGPDAVVEDAALKASVTDPLAAGLAALSADVVATSEVDLDGRRNSVRSMETNEGNLIADALLASATALAPSFGLKAPDVALQNGGGIRNNTIIPAGDISVLDTFDMVPFPNFVTVLEDIPHTQFKEIMENTVACTQPGDFTTNPDCGSGRFAQIAGFEMVWEPSGTAQIVDDDGAVLVPGTRVRHITLADGTMIYADGQPTGSARPITVVTVDFLAKGGDQYPFRDHPFTSVGTTYQKALQDFLEDKGTVTAAEYPEGGSGRIVLHGVAFGGYDPATATFVGGGGGPVVFGNPGDLGFVGDWDCDGRETPGLLRDGMVFLRNSWTDGPADIEYLAGDPGDLPLVGDFNGDGCDSVSLYRPSSQKVFVFESLGSSGSGLGSADASYTYGNAGDDAFAGDFDGDGFDTVGVFRPTTGDVLLRNSLDRGPADVQFVFGNPGDDAFSADFNRDGTDTIGVARGDVIYFRDSNTTGVADGGFPTGPFVPLAGGFG